MEFYGAILAVWLLTAAAGTPSTPPAPSCPQLWLVSTRGLGCGTPDSEIADRLEYWRHGESGWVPAESRDFRRQVARGSTSFFVHGNWVSEPDAFRMGPVIRQWLAGGAMSGRDAVVIWSWPAARDLRRPLLDVREKAARAESQGRFLARLVERLPQERPMALVGYSYGARLITSALQTAAQAERARPRLRAVLLAPALDDHWLLPGHRHGEAILQVDRMLILVNRQDPLLARYRFVYGRKSGAQALGFVGLPRRPEFGQVEQWRVDGYIGSTHDWTRYVHSCAVSERIRGFLSESPSNPPAVEERHASR